MKKTTLIKFLIAGAFLGFNGNDRVEALEFQDPHWLTPIGNACPADSIHVDRDRSGGVPGKYECWDLSVPHSTYGAQLNLYSVDYGHIRLMNNTDTSFYIDNLNANRLSFKEQTGVTDQAFINAQERLIIKYGGNVGIGTIDPQSLLDVNGSFQIQNGQSVNTIEDILTTEKDYALPTSNAVIDYVTSRTTAANMVTGTGTAGKITKWTSSGAVGDSNISEDTNGKKISVPTDWTIEATALNGQLDISDLNKGVQPLPFTWGDTEVADNITVNWAGLTIYPTGCSAGQAVTGIGAALTCNTFLTSEADPKVGTIINNYVPVFNTATNKLVTGTIYDNGNIGIGTSTPPDAKLEVEGNFFVDGSRIYGGSPTFRQTYHNAPNLKLQLESADTVNNQPTEIALITNLSMAGGGGSVLSFARSGGSTIGSDTYVKSGDYLGLISFSGTDSGSSYFKNGATITSVATADFSSTNSSANLLFATTGSGTSNAAVTRLIIKDDGNVGIGTTSPQSKLAVSGLPTAPPDASGNAGVVCVTNNGNFWLDSDGTNDCQ